MSHIAILGNGIAGITAARHIRKLSDHRLTVISAETDHFFSRTALMYIYMGHLTYEGTKPYEDGFWKKNRIDLRRGFVSSIDTDSKVLRFDDGQTLNYDTLIVATGSKPNKFGWKGQDLEGVQGLVTMQDLERMEENTRPLADAVKAGKPARAVVVGGGLIGIEMTEMLLSRKIPVTFLVREKNYWDNVLPHEEAVLIGKHIREHGVDLRLETALDTILSDEHGRARAVTTGTGEEIACQFVGLTAGVSPNIDVVKSSKIATGRGVLVNEYLETTVSGVYAAGDCVEIVPDNSSGNSDGGSHKKNRFEQLWYTGRMHGEVLAKTICGTRTKYDRGIWFNSAKFFDIEYQTYGSVSAAPVAGETALYWEHADGKKCIRIIFTDDEAQTVIGFNLLGIRYRQAVCERWIREKRALKYVLENLGEANFDPEFFKEHEADIVALHNAMHPDKPITLKRKKGLFSALQFRFS